MRHIEPKIISILAGFIFLLSGCKTKEITNVNSDQELKFVMGKYKNLSEENKTKVFNNILNYYQFSESKMALEFIKNRAEQRDPVAIKSIAIAKEFGVQIP
jgi:hypothetical protein